MGKLRSSAHWDKTENIYTNIFRSSRSKEVRALSIKGIKEQMQSVHLVPRAFAPARIVFIVSKLIVLSTDISRIKFSLTAVFYL